jgi:hypothetical protein
LHGDHHFFISFATTMPGVHISSKLKERYPEEITIVLQYQFENLSVDKNKFSVTLRFDGVKEVIVVPFKALTAFADPSVKFALQFKNEEGHHSVSTKLHIAKDLTEDKQNLSTPDNVITLDRFRNKHKK